MHKKRDIVEFIREHKTVIMILVVCLFLIEIEVFALAVMKSGRKARLHILNSSGEVIYETDGNNLSSFDKYYFENTFGPFENYDVKLVTREHPFPFRAWFSAAVGIPVGLVLLLAFIIRAFSSIFHGGRQENAGSDRFTGDETKFEKIIMRISRFNIFIIGFFVFLMIFSYWVIPNLLTYIGAKGVETISQHKWIVLSGVAVCLGLFIWIIYLKYLLAKKSIEERASVDKYRLKLAYDNDKKSVMQLDYNEMDQDDSKLIEYERKH